MHNVVYIEADWSPVSITMPPAFAALLARIRSFSLSIGQLTFGSFLLLLAVITATSMASVIAIRHIDATFAELQRLQDVGDLAEEIDRRMNEPPLAARGFVTHPGARPGPGRRASGARSRRSGALRAEHAGAADQRSLAARSGRRLRRRDHHDFGDGGRDRQARQGSAGHRRPADRARHRIAARTQRAAGKGALARLRADAGGGQVAEHRARYRRRPDPAIRGAVPGL